MDLFFTSLEKSFEIKKVAKDFKVEIIFNLVGERVYIYNIAVYVETWAEHLVYLETMYLKFLELQFSVNLRKCAFANPQIKYIGHIIGSGSHWTDPEKVESYSKPSHTPNEEATKKCSWFV